MLLYSIKGRVIEEGTLDALIARNGTYHDIFSAMANSLNLDKITGTLEEDADQETQ